MRLRIARSFIVTFIALALVLLAALSSAAPAHADAKVVTQCLDDTEFGQKLVGGGLITFNCNNVNQTFTIPFSQTYTISSPTTIDGGNTITLSGIDTRRLFNINNGSSLDLKNIVLEHGKSSDGGAIHADGFLAMEYATIQNSTASGNGGAIYSTSSADITHSTLANNKATNGGALYASGAGASITFAVSSLHDNQATGSGSNIGGGAIYALGGASLNIFSGDIDNNTAYEGGGIFLQDLHTSLNLQGSLVRNNSTVEINANVRDGGGIYNTDQATATVNNTMFIGNIASSIGDGGAIMNYGGTLTLTHSTISGGNAEHNAYYGGAISNWFATATLTNVTISGNSAIVEGGAFNNDAGTMNLTNVTLDGNSAGTGGGMINGDDSNIQAHLNLTNVIINNSKSGGNCKFNRTPDSANSNFSSDDTCNFGTGRDTIKLKLGKLETNGGSIFMGIEQLPLLTQRLYPGSPAIDGGAGSGCPGDDERSITRPQNGTCDAGAFEFVPCPGSPSAPQLISPAKRAKVSASQVLLDWVGPDCAVNFSVVVHRGAKAGPIVFSKSKLKPSQVITSALSTKGKYFWQVTACNDQHICTTSSWGIFKK